MADWLKVFATFQSKHSLQVLRQMVTEKTEVEDDVLYVQSARISVSIMACGAEEFLARGDVADFPALQDILLTKLKGEVDTLQMDVFEEDGRLLKRITKL